MPNPLEQRVAELEKIIADMRKTDRYVFAKDTQFMDGRDVIVAKGRGTLIGTETTQKLGFFGARSSTPVIQPTADTVNPVANTYSTAYFADSSYGNNELNMINAMFQAMIGLGLIREV